MSALFRRPDADDEAASLAMVRDEPTRVVLIQHALRIRRIENYIAIGIALLTGLYPFILAVVFANAHL